VKIRHRIIIAILLLIVSSGIHSPVYAEISSTQAQSLQPATPIADIEVFVREGCPHCEKAKLFLQTLQQEQPQLKISIRDVQQDPAALERLRLFAKAQNQTVRVPTFQINGELIIGYIDEQTSGSLLRNALSKRQNPQPVDDGESCTLEKITACENDKPQTAKADDAAYQLNFFGRTLSLAETGLPLFTLAMGLLDGFNPCSMWVLILVISLLAPMRDRWRMLIVAGTFVAVEGIVYFVFMAAWLNLFLLIGLSRLAELVIAGLALLAGFINLKDFWFFGQGISLSIPDSAKPGIYAQIRRVLQAKNLTAAVIGVIILALLVQIVEFLCTSGFPALYTKILTLQHLSAAGYYGYLLLYNLAYMADDVLVLAIGIVTLSQRRLQEKEGRWLKLISGLVMVGLGIYLAV
jgi:glutaredoxin